MEISNEEHEHLNDFLEDAELLHYYDQIRNILKITKVSQLKFVVREDLAQIGLSKPEQRRYKKTFSKYFPNPYLTKLKKFLHAHKKNVPNIIRQLPIEMQPFPATHVLVPSKHIISIDEITINKELGMGQFGVVQQGTWSTGLQRVQVAIKCLGPERMSSNSTEFLKEAAVMHSIDHPNIVRLFGVVLHMDSLMLVTELAPLRSLLECLRESNLRSFFTVDALCEFAEQICAGMTYLENKRLIHRDLAARNILVFSKDTVKISDFGLSRALGVGKDYYQSNYNVNLKLPVAWCAPECILYLRFTSASDVWAYAVCLWEMFTYGFQPWAGFSGQQILEAIDAPNYQRLERPECCPEGYYELMQECWAHEAQARPKFKELGPRLASIRPELVEVTVASPKMPDGRRTCFLELIPGQIITVLGKESVTKCAMWYGVIQEGNCGLFDPTKVTPYTKPYRAMAQTPTALSSHPTRHSARSLRPLLRSDVKRHTFTGKRTIQRSMISGPQGDVKHTGHVGLDGAYFGDISFLDQVGCTPRQIVSPYRPVEDLEQVPLINPNSPSHLSGASSLPHYPLLTARTDGKDRDEVDLACGVDSNSRSLRKSHQKSENRNFFSKMKSATLGLSKKEDHQPAAANADEDHEYHEISDTDTESNAPDNGRGENLVLLDSDSLPKSSNDFSQSLLHEMETMFRTYDTGRPGEPGPSTRHHDVDVPRAHTLNKAEKKKSFHTGTMKPMSAHDERTLETAVALANEITTKSMTDLGSEHRVPPSPSERTKFHFKFPQLSLHHSGPTDVEKEANIKREERRNFSEEAKSVPNIQETITEESKMAYTSLIEQPTPASVCLAGAERDVFPSPAPGPPAVRSPPAPLSPPCISAFSTPIEYRQPSTSQNELPLPPRSSKPKLVDRPRHVRKYPLKLPENVVAASTAIAPVTNKVIYQNAMVTCVVVPRTDASSQTTTENGSDVCDGPTATEKGTDTNPFTRSSGNPFRCMESSKDFEAGPSESQPSCSHEGSLVKEHVSVEDLLEFADLKPCGRQRGGESDEVRVMCKVFKQQVTPEECLHALELSDWSVHHAIKIMRVRSSVGPDADLEACALELARANGDVVKAGTAIVLGDDDSD